MKRIKELCLIFLKRRDVFLHILCKNVLIVGSVFQSVTDALFVVSESGTGAQHMSDFKLVCVFGDIEDSDIVGNLNGCWSWYPPLYTDEYWL